MSADREILEKLYIARAVDLDQIVGRFPRLKYAIVHHRNTRGQPMTFADKPYLVRIFMDTAEEIVLQSSVQTGKSEWAIISALAWAERGLQVMYVLPSELVRNQFVANRVDRTIQAVPYYQAQLGRTTNVAMSRGLKHYGKGSIFFAGSNSATTFIEKPLDLIIADELDRFDLANYEKADDRMTASPYKLKYELSNPTVENFGINARFMLSDQRHWFNRCLGCGKWQAFEWFENVVRQTDDNQYILRDTEWSEGCGRDIHICCKQCNQPLDRFSIKGTWVIKNNRVQRTHGYHIHQMLSAYVRIDLMWARFRAALNDDTKMQVFYNSMLGDTFAGAGSKLTREILDANKYEYLMPAHVSGPCIMGVDVGRRLHVVVREITPGENLRAVFIGTLRDFEELDILFKRFNIVGYVIDAMPETRKATEWALKHPGRGWICRYHQGLKEVQLDEKERVVSADRTMIMDRVQKWFLDRKLPIPRNAQSIDAGDYYRMLLLPTRIYDEEKDRFNWLGDPDHYFHAENYCLLAYIARGEFKVVGIPIGQPAYAPVPETFDEVLKEMNLPPGTPPGIVEHYRRIYENVKRQGLMPGKIDGGT